MTKRASAVAAMMLLCAIYVFFAYVATGHGRNVAAEAFGAAFGALAFPAILSALIGFVGGAIKQGAFKNVFFWTYICMLPLFVIASQIGSAQH